MDWLHKKAFWMSLASIVDIVLKGVPPLNLESSIANSIKYVKAYGGLLQGGVPSGYTAVEYVENATEGMVKSAIHIGNEDNFKMDITATVVSGSFYLFQARDVVGQNYGNATICGISGSQNGGTIIGGSGGSNSLTSGITRPNRDGHKLNIVFECADGDMSLYVKDIDGNVSDTKTGTYDPTALTRPETNMCIYGNEAPTISTALPKNRLAAGCKVYGAKLWKNGILVLDYVPATRNSDSAVGFYDRISGTFVIAADGSLTAGSSLTPTPSDPMDVYCNNGKISVLDHTNWNIITNPTSQTGQGMFINSDGKLQRANDRGAGVFIPVTVGKQYTLLINKKTTALGSIIRYGQSNNGDLPNSAEQLLDWYRGAIEDTMMISFTAKRPYFVMQLAASLVEAGGIDEAVEVIEAQGDNETLKLTPSNDTAGVTNLLKIDDYADTQEILTGLINHQLGILVLNGLETYNVQYPFYIHNDSCDAFVSINGVKSMSAQDAIGACTHLKLEKGTIWSGSGYPNTFTFNTNQLHMNFAHDVIGTTSSSTTEEASAAIKSYIAVQYAAGTPVIIVYPLATAQDEVALIPQTMQTVAGDNTLDIVQAGMSGLEVEAEYKKQG